VYSIAKAGLAAMTKILAKEFGPAIRVNGVAPGPYSGRTMICLNRKSKKFCSGGFEANGEPDDIARQYGFDQGCDYMTGQILTVDGGRTLFC